MFLIKLETEQWLPIIVKYDTILHSCSQITLKSTLHISWILSGWHSNYYDSCEINLMNNYWCSNMWLFQITFKFSHFEVCASGDCVCKELYLEHKSASDNVIFIPHIHTWRSGVKVEKADRITSWLFQYIRNLLCTTTG